MDNFGLLFAKSLGGSGSSGTDNYNELSNKPQINSITLSGNKSLANLGIQAELIFDDEPTEDSTNPVTSGAVYTALATKQDMLTVDSSPTENSTNPVQSGGVYTALAGKEDTLTFDNAPTNNSDNPVKSGGIYTALGQKQDALTFDGTYSASTNKAATVSTVTNAVNALDVTGDASVSASKTISAWSETDGKVSISTQDIAIAGTQTTLTGYAKSGTAGQAVATTDNVNQAIGKIEATVDDNKNNILTDEAALVELVDGGAKNRWKITIPATLPTGFTATIDTDGGLILNGETGSSTLAFTTSTQFHAGETVVLSGCPAGGSDESYRIDILRGDNSNYCYGDPVIASNFAEATYQVRIRIAANYTCNNLKFFPMVCTLAAWKISQSFQPYRPSYQELYDMVNALQAQLANQ